MKVLYQCIFIRATLFQAIFTQMKDVSQVLKLLELFYPHSRPCIVLYTVKYSVYTNTTEPMVLNAIVLSLKIKAEKTYRHAEGPQ